MDSAAEAPDNAREQAFDVIEKAVGVALTDAFRFVDRPEVDLDPLEYKAERKKSVFDIHFQLFADRKRTNYPGHVAEDGVPVLDYDEIDGHVREQEAAAIAREVAPSKLRKIVTEAKFGKSQLYEENSAISKHRCGSCSGHGTLRCETCRGVGKEDCNCRFGKMRCYSCQATGYAQGSYGQNDGNHHCPTCAGNGWVLCSRCGGISKVDCSNCGGDGKLYCNPCGRYGLTSTVHSFELSIDTKLLDVSTDYDKDEAARVRAWVLAGIPGAVTNLEALRDRILPFANIDHAKPDLMKEASGLQFRLQLQCVTSLHSVSSSYEGRPVKITYRKLGKDIVRFNPFLDSEVKRAADTVAALSAASPAEFKQAIAEFKGIREALHDAWEGKSDGEDFAGLVETGSHGAISNSAAKRIGDNFRSCLANFKRHSVKRVSFLPIAVLAVLWIAAQMYHVNWGLRSLGLFGFILFTAVPAAISAMIIKFVAERRIRRETGHSGSVQLGIEGLTIPISAAVLFAATDIFGIDVWPF